MSPQIEDIVASTEKKLLETAITGTVKWFNVKRGYGFIARSDKEDESVFVHRSAITRYNPNQSVPSVSDGELVEFDIVQGDKGTEAVNVTGPNGANVTGSPYAGEYYSFRPRGLVFHPRHQASRVWRFGRNRGTPIFRRPVGPPASQQADQQADGAPHGDRIQNQGYHPRQYRGRSRGRGYIQRSTRRDQHGGRQEEENVIEPVPEQKEAVQENINGQS